MTKNFVGVQYAIIMIIQTTCSGFFPANESNSPPFNHPCTLICRNNLAVTSTRGVNSALRGSVTAGRVVLMINMDAVNAGRHIHVRTNDRIPRVIAQMNDMIKPNRIDYK